MTSLFSYSYAVLQTSEPSEKVRLTKKAWTRWQEGALPFKHKEESDTLLPDYPARPERPILLSPSRMPRRSTGQKGRLALLHALAHIELNAIDLAWDMIGRFGADDRVECNQFCGDWLRVGFEEGLHFELLDGRLKELGITYGDYPAHDNLWQAAVDTRYDLEARLAVVPMVLEARGLDVTPSMIHLFQNAKDNITASLLTRIYQDEISHVQKGVFWFHHVVRLPPTQHQAQFHTLLKKHFKGALKAPFNKEARTQAGMPPNYYEAYIPPIRPASFVTIYRQTQSVTPQHQGAIWCLGNFDGVHLGHQALLKKAFQESRRIKKPWGVITFEPHPRTFFKPLDPPFRLTSFRTKVQYLKQYGTELLLNLRFSKTLANLTPEAFCEELLVNQLKALHIFIGHDFFFGKGRVGTPQHLVTLGEKYGFKVTILEPQCDEQGIRFASETVRDALKHGHIQQTHAMLGHSWKISGRVIEGKKLGRTLGFPTANLLLKQQISSAYGVYGVHVWRRNADIPFKGIANIGIRPTVTQERMPVCEVHLLEFQGDLYGERLCVEPLVFLRPEKKFDSLDDLKDQILVDIQEFKTGYTV